MVPLSSFVGFNLPDRRVERVFNGRRLGLLLLLLLSQGRGGEWTKGEREPRTPTFVGRVVVGSLELLLGGANLLLGLGIERMVEGAGTSVPAQSSEDEATPVSDAMACTAEAARAIRRRPLGEGTDTPDLLGEHGRQREREGRLGAFKYLKYLEMVANEDKRDRGCANACWLSEL